MNMLKQVAMVMMLTVGAVGLAEAHHAGNSQFDGNKNLAFTGVLEKMYVGNPHGYLYFVRMMPNGQQQKWTFQTEAILALRRAGLSIRNSLQIGTTYSLVYSPSLDGSNGGFMTAIKLSDGRIVAFQSKADINAANKLLNEKLLNGTQNSQNQQ